MPDRPIKLGEMIERLIEDRGRKDSRKKISAELGITSSTLTQYKQGQIKPSFDKLIALARFFEVSLDYLVFGESARSDPEDDHEPTVRFLDFALANVQARTSRHSAIVARIGRMLSDQIDHVADGLASSPAATREGLVQDEELFQLEGYCHQADIISLDLSFDFVPVTESGRPGNFLAVVARNLRKGTRYRFLLPGEDSVPKIMVDSFRSVLAEQVGGDLVRQFCRFRRTESALMTGAELYQLDIEAMQEASPGLYAQFLNDIDANRWFGCVIRSNDYSNSDMILDLKHLSRAKINFETMWLNGQPVDY